VATGNDAVTFRNQTVRVNITNARTLATQREAIERFVTAYRETVRWLYSGDDPLKIYAEWLGISLAKAKRTRDEFYPWEALDPDKIVGLDAIVRDAVTLKYLSAPLTQAQLDELVVKFAP
jgi:NitT/TauT family transport system substrate-binding protein